MTSPNGNLPWRDADERFCNARLLHGVGYCVNKAGEGTNHLGEGRCSLHGGEVLHNADVKEIISANGLQGLVDIAETMDWDDAEYMYHVANSALIILRAKIVSRLGDSSASAKELADLTMALQRIDNLLSKYKREILDGQEQNLTNRQDEDERERLETLARKYG